MEKVARFFEENPTLYWGMMTDRTMLEPSFNDWEKVQVGLLKLRNENKTLLEIFQYLAPFQKSKNLQ